MKDFKKKKKLMLKQDILLRKQVATLTDLFDNICLMRMSWFSKERESRHDKFKSKFLMAIGKITMFKVTCVYHVDRPRSVRTQITSVSQYARNKADILLL